MINRRIFYFSTTLSIPRGQRGESILLPLLLGSCLLKEISPFTFLRHFYHENPKRFFVLQILDAKPKRFFVIYIYSFHMMGLYIRISIRVHHLRLLSRSFNRKFLSKNRVPSFRGLIFHSVSKRKRGGEGREETRMERSQRSKPSSIRHPWENRSSPSNGERLFSFSNFAAKLLKLRTPETLLKGKKGIEERFLGCEGKRKKRNGKREKKARKRGRGRSEAAGDGRVKYTSHGCKSAARLISAFLAPKIFAPLSAPA